MKKRVIFHTKPGQALRRQKKIDPFYFPFTLNPCIGCLFGCSYCDVQWSSFPHTVFGKEIKVKTWMPHKLNKELYKYRGLPQHLKRVQVNTSCESYLPRVMLKTRRETGKDIMRQILEVFARHWHEGNPWMVHLLTKSHVIVNHLDILTDMRRQVQVELTITTLDERMRREFEGHASSVKRRLKTVERLALEGVFVRVMGMPVTRREDAERIRRVGLDAGAMGFKHKGPHYWGDGNVLDEEVSRTKGPEYHVFWDLFVRSGEPEREQGHPKTVNVVMPTPTWREWTEQDVKVENSGYSELNDIDWGYLV